MTSAEWLDFLGHHMGIEAARIPVVIASAVCIYLGFLLIMRVFGPRILTATASFDAVVTVMFGAIAGRVVIGHPPSVAAGLIGISTLVCLEAVFGAVRSWWTARRPYRLAIQPILVVAHGEIQPDLAHQARLTEVDIRAAARQAGIGSLQDVAAMVLEANGKLAIIRAGTTLDRALFDRVIGAQRLAQVP